MSESEYAPGDIVNNSILGEDNQWYILEDTPEQIKKQSTDKTANLAANIAGSAIIVAIIALFPALAGAIYFMYIAAVLALVGFSLSLSLYARGLKSEKRPNHFIITTIALIVVIAINLVAMFVISDVLN